MKDKIIPVVAEAYATDFFTINADSEDLSQRPHLRLPQATSAMFALQLADDGLNGLGIDAGDYLLFAQSALLTASGQVSLIQREDEYIVRLAYWNGDFTILETANPRYSPLSFPSENIRISAVLDNVIKASEDLQLVTFS